MMTFVSLVGARGDIVLGNDPQVALENYRTTPASSSVLVGRNESFFDIQWAAGFTTGNQLSSLDSALFLYNGTWPGTTGGFQFALHQDQGGLPGAQAVVLQGPDRPVNGITWYSAPDYVLQKNSTYWLVASAPQTESPRYFEWRSTSSDSEVSNLADWQILDYSGLRTDLGEWQSSSAILHTAVQITAIPEPTSLGLIGLSSGMLFFVRNLRRRRKAGMSILPVRPVRADEFPLPQPVIASVPVTDRTLPLHTIRNAVSFKVSDGWRRIAQWKKSAGNRFWDQLIAFDRKKVKFRKKAVRGFDALLALIIR